MKIRFNDQNGKSHKVTLPYENATFLNTKMTCPHCGMENIDIKGMGMSIDPEHSRDTYKADAIHPVTECQKFVGHIRVKMDTIFGLEEDEAVLVHGRPRVY